MKTNNNRTTSVNRQPMMKNNQKEGDLIKMKTKKENVLNEERENEKLTLSNVIDKNGDTTYHVWYKTPNAWSAEIIEIHPITKTLRKFNVGTTRIGAQGPGIESKSRKVLHEYGRNLIDYHGYKDESKRLT